jgi:hypothetical protein
MPAVSHSPMTSEATLRPSPLLKSPMCCSLSLVLGRSIHDFKSKSKCDAGLVIKLSSGKS